MSAITWLPLGMEQDAPPISQRLPEVRALSYCVGGDRTIRDASDARFNPHFWLFVRSTAHWRAGYDQHHINVYVVTLYQYEVFNVLLVDYWKPPVEAIRFNLPIDISRVTFVGTEPAGLVPTFGSEASAAPTFMYEIVTQPIYLPLGAPFATLFASLAMMAPPMFVQETVTVPVLGTEPAPLTPVWSDG